MKCVFCGSKLESTSNREPYIKSSYDASEQPAVICRKCIKKSAEMMFPDFFVDEKPKENTDIIPLPKGFRVIPPTEIFDYLKKYVCGQDDYLMSLSIFGYKHLKRMYLTAQGVPRNELPNKSNLLISGHTGSGKTFGLKMLVKLLNIPYLIYDVTTLTQTGYYGPEIRDVLKSLVKRCGNTKIAEQHSILILDEIDKLATRNDVFSNEKDVSGRGVQMELLQIASSYEDDTIDLESGNSRNSQGNKENILRIGAIPCIGIGAFSGLDKIRQSENPKIIGFNKGLECSTIETHNDRLNDALIKYGLLPELLGRFDSRAILNQLTEDHLRLILSESKSAILNEFVNQFSNEGIKLEFSSEAISLIAKRAHSTGTGARALRQVLLNVLGHVAFGLFGTSTTQCVSVLVDPKTNEIACHVLSKDIENDYKENIFVERDLEGNTAYENIDEPSKDIQVPV